MNSIQDSVTCILNDSPLKLVISKPASKDQPYQKITIEQKGSYYQIAKSTKKQVFHENVAAEQLYEKCADYLETSFRQMNAWSKDKEYSVSVSKKKKVLFRAKTSKTPCDLPWQPAHNRVKNYILPEGRVIPPLVDMGIFTAQGKVVRSMYDKYRQINRFIELIDDVIKKESNTHLNIIDFGCGKSYLTFILYYYLTEIRNLSVDIIGLDLKEDVIMLSENARPPLTNTVMTISGLSWGTSTGFPAPLTWIWSSPSMPATPQPTMPSTTPRPGTPG